MAAVNPVSAQFSSAMAFSSSAVGGATGCSGTDAATASGDVAAMSGALGMQTSLMLQQGNGLSNVDTLAAMALMMLLNKSNDSQKSSDDGWKMLAMMALLSGQGQGAGQTTFSFSQSIGDPSGVYSAGGVAAGASINFQG